MTDPQQPTERPADQPGARFTPVGDNYQEGVPDVQAHRIMPGSGERLMPDGTRVHTAVVYVDFDLAYPPFEPGGKPVRTTMRLAMDRNTAPLIGVELIYHAGYAGACFEHNLTGDPKPPGELE